ncbi:MAG: DCC1-like thiol-disulfide oxidoreductase family protein [Pyrinomonadaceae bacterium]
MAVGASLLFRFFTEVPYATYLWGPHGLGYGSARPKFGYYIGGLLDQFFYTEAGTYAIFLIMAGGAFCLLMGYWTRIATLITMVTFQVIVDRLPELNDGGDNITNLILFYLLFALPVGARPARGSLRIWLHNVGVLAIGAQLIILYLTSAFLKLSGDVWHHGTAMYLISQVEWFSIPYSRELFKNSFMTTMASYSAMFIQIWFPIALFSRLKIAWVLIGIGFHLGIAFFMGLLTFSAMMIGLELFVISDDEYRRFWHRAQMMYERLKAFFKPGVPAEQPALILFIDGFCSYCRSTGRIIRALDLRGIVRVISFRHDPIYLRYGITAQELEARMYIVETDSGRVRAGFDAVRAVTQAIMLLYPLRPLLALLSGLGQGDRFYNFLASRRRIIPDPRSCAEAACEINPLIQPSPNDA